DCPSTLTLQKRIDCLNTALGALQTAHDVLVASNASLQAQLDALDDEVANISADYLVSGDLDGYATVDYVDSAVAGATGGIPNLAESLSVEPATNSIIFTGANLYVQSGSGATDGWVNGLGNLVIGY